VVVDGDDLYLVGWSLRLPGEPAGNESYAAPEQEWGETGPASDVYSVGALAVRLITGRRFDRVGDDWTESVHPRVAAVLMAMLEPEPRARPTAAKASSVLRALADIPESRASAAQDSTPVESAASGSGLSLVQLMIAVAIIGVLAAVAIPLLVETESEEPADVEAPALPDAGGT
jgi:serine/threonine protein kinase